MGCRLRRRFGDDEDDAGDGEVAGAVGGGVYDSARLRMGERGYLVWGPALFNSEGSFVQNVRRDTLRKMMRLGIIGDGDADIDGRVAGQGKDAYGTDDAALDVAPAGGPERHMDRDSE